MNEEKEPRGPSGAAAAEAAADDAGCKDKAEAAPTGETVQAGEAETPLVDEGVQAGEAAAPCGPSLEGIAFVGDALAPFFLQDPRTGNAGAAFAALAALDVESAAAEWPFVEAGEAVRDLGLMRQGLADGVDDDALVWEYRRLFVGPDLCPAPPWGEVYTERDCVVFGESTLALRDWMRGRGIARTTDERTPEDHIGLMLALMAWVARNQPAALDDYLSLHLLTWSSHFLGRLEDVAEHPFYRGLARLTRASLEGIQRDRGLTVVYPKFYR